MNSSWVTADKDDKCVTPTNIAKAQNQMESYKIPHYHNFIHHSFTLHHKHPIIVWSGE